MGRLVSAGLLVAIAAGIGALAVGRLPIGTLPFGAGGRAVAVDALLLTAIVAAAFGAHRLVLRALDRDDADRRRVHTLRNVSRLGFAGLAGVGVLGVITAQWVGVLFSLGVVGFAVTFALQQPLLSLIGWGYIVAKRPYAVGDRVAIEGTKGDVIDVDYLVTTLWEIDGELVASNQPSGRVVTVPNSVALSASVANYSWEEFPHVWNELAIEVAYETDLAFAREELQAVADDYIGDEMAANVARYRELLDETPVELEVQDRPSVNVAQRGSWVELRLRYLVHPRRGQRVKNQLYERILDRFNEHPDRVKFPVGRNR
jgi:small-conductance mechanosensitive channel